MGETPRARRAGTSVATDRAADYATAMTVTAPTAADADQPIDNGTLDPLPGMERTITLDELLRGGRPLTVLERLERHALGKEHMEPSEIQAGKIFLDKTVPTLKATEHTGKDGGPVQVAARIELVDLK